MRRAMSMPPIILFFVLRGGGRGRRGQPDSAARDPIHSALSLIVVMVSLAGLYLLLGAEFIAAVQIIVYAGAIMVLFVFVIMLLNAGEEERTQLEPHREIRRACRSDCVPAAGNRPLARARAASARRLPTAPAHPSRRFPRRDLSDRCFSEQYRVSV